MNNVNWSIIFKIHEEKILKNFEKTNRIFALSIIGCIILLFFNAFIFSKKLVYPIKEILSFMKNIEHGNFNIKINVQSNDEIGQLAVGFNNMVKQLNEYIDKAYMAQIKQKEAELNALKTQIRPHYLYNTLEVIRMSAIDNEQTIVADMIQSLSKQLKYVIGYTTDKVQLYQEIDMIKNYFYLIEVRFEGRIKLELKVDENLLNVTVIKFILQPLVENAVEHGLKPKESDGLVLIRVEQNDNDMEISIFDNGIGMSKKEKESIDEIISGQKIGVATDEGWQNIGLKNVNDRLQMNYGKDHGVTVTSQENIGTVVKLKIPLIKEDDIYENKNDGSR